MASYCDFAAGHPIHGPYHDREYGFPIEDESGLFERLLLEINQAGLNWELILKKREGFRRAYSDFDVDAVADYGEADRKRLLGNPDIVRNRLKINAAIHNAGVIREMRNSHGGFAGWLQAQHPLRKPEWVKRFKKAFKFTGGEITGEFLSSIGYLPSPHRPDCPVHSEIEALSPPWFGIPAEFWK
ncbi:MAG: DNA-3-methyladenine glycosylase I [Gammaproteobacteria bacterium]|nr:DNA-3-methyladenine glycosylase I [Gammaproteobacteria bacterium]NNK33643.1 DNA-3-methyladenine glycosylase I [Xanthomonadales bacterium]